MKVLIHAILIVFIFLPAMSTAQLGWKWGRENDTAGFIGAQTGPVAIDASGNIYSVAVVKGWPAVIFGTKSAGLDGIHTTLCVTKTDSSGHCLWVKGTQHSDVSFVSIAVDSVGNSYLFGCYQDSSLTIDGVTLTHPGHKHWEYFLMKLSPSGSVLWARNVRSAANYKITGGSDGGYIALDNSGNSYVTGSFYDSVIVITPAANDTIVSEDIFLAKFDANGGFCWERDYFGNMNDWPTAIAVTLGGDIYLSGQFYSDSIEIGSTTLINPSTTLTSQRLYSFIARIDSAGNEVLANNLRGHIRVNAMVTDASGYLYACGWYDSSTTLGPFLLVNTSHPLKDEDVFTAKFTAAGDPMWVRTANGINSDVAFSLTMGICGKLWVTGRMSQSTTAGYSLDFEGRKLYSLSGNMPIFIAAYDTSGSYFTSISLPGGGGSTHLHYTGIVADKMGDFYISGNYINATMVFGSDTLNKIIGLDKLFIARYAYDVVEAPCTTNSVEGPAKFSADIQVYPNPATAQLTISSGILFSPGAAAIICDLAGRTLVTCPLAGHEAVISLADVAPGMYLCRVVNGGDVVSKKVVVMK